MEGHRGVRFSDDRRTRPARGRLVSRDAPPEVVRLTAEGNTAQQAADILSLSPTTVETYRHRAMQKLGLTNRAELVRSALRAGLLATEEA